jgi:hypothetical protein
MDRKKLEKLQEELDAMRRTQIRASALESLAARLGRALGNRGKHPMWENLKLAKRPPLSIPDHGQRDISPTVRKVCFNVLQGDIDAWGDWLKQTEGNNGNGEGT